MIGYGGNGGYSKGIINLAQNTSLYLYIGAKGGNGSVKLVNNKWTGTGGSGGWNGGGSGIWDGTDEDTGGGGGGATDVRLNNGTWSDFNCLKSRIMIAGGGGGGSFNKTGGVGGGINGGIGMGNEENRINATQTSGYKFGQGQNAFHPTNKSNDGGGGGGGYYGGTTVNTVAMSNSSDSGGGGSGFISGHAGCNAINSSSTESKITHTGSPNHYSGKVFTNTVMKAGNEVMPSPTGGTEIGHTGNGYCKITWHPSL